MKFESALESEEVIFYNDSNTYLIFKRIMDFILSFIALFISNSVIILPIPPLQHHL